MVEESMNGLMEENTMVNGRIITCTAEEFIHGKMEEDMKEIISMIESMDMVFIHGKMADNTLDIGRMENNMVKAPIDKLVVKKRKESGKTEKESSGLIEKS
jgi:hypothetical protein